MLSLPIDRICLYRSVRVSLSLALALSLSPGLSPHYTIDLFLTGGFLIIAIYLFPLCHRAKCFGCRKTTASPFIGFRFHFLMYYSACLPACMVDWLAGWLAHWLLLTICLPICLLSACLPYCLTACIPACLPDRLRDGHMKIVTGKGRDRGTQTRTP